MENENICKEMQFYNSEENEVGHQFSFSGPLGSILNSRNLTQRPHGTVLKGRLPLLLGLCSQVTVLLRTGSWGQGRHLELGCPSHSRGRVWLELLRERLTSGSSDQPLALPRTSHLRSICTYLIFWVILVTQQSGPVSTGLSHNWGN